MNGGSVAGAGKSEPEGDLRELTESTNDLLWSVDLDFHLQTYNRAYAVLVAGVTGTGAEPLWREPYERALREGPYRTLHTFSEGSVYELAFWPLGGTGVAVSGRESVAGARYEGRQRTTDGGSNEVSITPHAFDEGLLTVVVRRIARGAEAKFATLFRTTPAITTVVRLDVHDAFVSRLGYGREEMAGRGVDGLDGAFLQKPFQPEVLAAAVREVLV